MIPEITELASILVNVFFMLFIFALILMGLAFRKSFWFINKTGINRLRFIKYNFNVAVLFFILAMITVPVSLSENTSNSVVSDTSTVQVLSADTSVSLSDSPIPARIIPTPTGMQIVRVSDVIDGDTVRIDTGEVVRYIGIDTPETVDPRSPVICYGREAYHKNLEMVGGREIFLEKDISEVDRYGRLLRYVWVDGDMVNRKLMEEGYAKVSTFPPDVRYQTDFLELEKFARQNELGLWGPSCSKPQSD